MIELLTADGNASSVSGTPGTVEVTFDAPGIGLPEGGQVPLHGLGFVYIRRADCRQPVIKIHHQQGLAGPPDTAAGRLDPRPSPLSRINSFYIIASL